MLEEQVVKLERQRPALARALSENGFGYQCTDCCCCYLLLGSIVLLAVIFAHAVKHGDVRKLYHGIDYHGRLCGICSDVRDEPYLYWCPAAVVAGESNKVLTRQPHASVMPASHTSVPARQLAGGSNHTKGCVFPKMGSGVHPLSSIASSSAEKSPTGKWSHDRPMCVKSCPRTDKTHRNCMQTVDKISEHGYDGSWTEHSSYNYSNVQDYPTVLVVGYCFLVGLKLRYILGARLDHITEAMMLYPSQAKRA